DAGSRVDLRAWRGHGRAFVGQVLAGHPQSLVVGRCQSSAAGAVAPSHLVSAAPAPGVVPCPRDLSGYLVSQRTALAGTTRSSVAEAPDGNILRTVPGDRLSPPPQFGGGHRPAHSAPPAPPAPQHLSHPRRSLDAAEHSGARA